MTIEEQSKLENWCDVFLVVTKYRKFGNKTATSVWLFLSCYMDVKMCLEASVFWFDLFLIFGQKSINKGVHRRMQWCGKKFSKNIFLKKLVVMRNVYSGLESSVSDLNVTISFLVICQQGFVKTNKIVWARLYTFREHSFKMYETFSEKLTFLTLWYAHVHVRIIG